MVGDLILKPLYDFRVCLHGRDARAYHGPSVSLRHFDHLPVFHSSVASGGRFFSDQLGCDPQRFYFLFDSLDFLLFLRSTSRGFFMGDSLSAIKINCQSGTDSKPPGDSEKHHEGTRLLS